jgi:uncharacterized protein (TIRG00374 family)
VGSRRRGAALLGLAVSLVAVAVLAARVDGRAVWAAMAGARVPVLLLSLVTKAAGFVFLSARSRTLFLRFRRWPLSGFLAAHLLGFGGNVVLPLRMGELLRVDELARRTALGRSICLGAVVIERGLDSLWVLALAVALPAFATLDLGFPTLVASLLVFIALALAAAAWLGARPERIVALAGRIGRRFGERAGAWSERVVGGFASGLSMVGSARRFVGASWWTLCYWASGIVGVELWLRAFDLALPWYASTVVIVFLAVGSALPAAPGFVGTYDLAAVTALSLFGVETSRATALAVTGHFISTVPATLVALAMFFGRIRGFAAAPAVDGSEARRGGG